MSPLACARTEQLWNERQLEQTALEPAWRLWRYRQPAVVLGCSQRGLLAGVAAAADMDIVLRSAGGGAVLVGPWMLGLSVALPPSHELVSKGVLASYRWLGELLATVLQDEGIAATALSPAAARAAAPDRALDWACFGNLSPWEVVAGGRKLAGLAQVRRRHGVLLVGGLLLDAPDWPLLCARLRKPQGDADALARRTTSLAGQCGAREPPQTIARRLSRAICAAVRPPPIPSMAFLGAHVSSIEQARCKLL